MPFLKYYATYTFYKKFLVPPEYQLDNKEVVHDHWIKWNTMYIKLVSGEIIEIEGFMEESECKFPDKFYIEDPDLTDDEN